MINKDNTDKFFKNAESLDQQRLEMTMEQSINPSFLAKCSRFKSLEEMFIASGFNIENADDFAAIPDEEWEIFIVQNTTYSSWEEMQLAALSEQAASFVQAHLAKGL